MSLNWSTREIPDVVTHWPREGEENPGPYQSPVTYALIWAMLGLGIDGKITMTNVEEAVVQVMALQLRDGPLVQGDPDRAPRVYITPADVRAHVGLWTNVWGPNHTRVE